MFDLLLTLCLAAAPDSCVERRVAFPQPHHREECAAAAPERIEAWLAERPALLLEGWSCAPSAAAAALEAVEVAPGVLVHAGRIETPGAGNDGDVANLGAVIGEEAVAVIDAGGSRAVGEAWLAAVRRATDKPVRWLILTHMHPDHVLGASVFAEAGAEVVGHPRLAAALAARRQTYLENFERLLGQAAVAGTVIPVPQGVDGPAEIDLGSRVLLLAPQPTAHTDNDLTVLDRQSGTLFTGDLVFLDHAPALDGSIRGWLQVLETMTAQEGIRRLVPGHGPAQAEWPGGLRPTRDYLDALGAETRAAIAAGEPMSRAIRHLGESQRPGWLLFDEYNPRNATAAYKELEWE